MVIIILTISASANAIIIILDVAIMRTAAGQSRQACGAMALAKEVRQGPRASEPWGFGSWV